MCVCLVGVPKPRTIPLNPLKAQGWEDSQDESSSFPSLELYLTKDIGYKDKMSPWELCFCFQKGGFWMKPNIFQFSQPSEAFRAQGKHGAR